MHVFSDLNDIAYLNSCTFIDKTTKIVSPSNFIILDKAKEGQRKNIKRKAVIERGQVKDSCRY